MAFTRVLGPGIHTQANIDSHNINSTGIITAVSFVGDGSGLTGVASTDNIITSTEAKLLGGVVTAGIVTVGTALSLTDSVKAKFGASGDLRIFHDGSHSYVQDGGTGDLLIDGSIVKLRNAGGTKNSIIANDGGVFSDINTNLEPEYCFHFASSLEAA